MESFENLKKEMPVVAVLEEKTEVGMVLK